MGWNWRSRALMDSFEYVYPISNCDLRTIWQYCLNSSNLQLYE
jgi:hypothetical protein